MALNNNCHINNAAVTHKNTDRPRSGEETVSRPLHSGAFTAIIGCLINVSEYNNLVGSDRIFKCIPEWSGE